MFYQRMLRRPFGLKSLLIPALLVAALIFTVIAAYLERLHSSIDLPTGHLDGAFQTASGLYRLAAGQSPGKDFFPYLGIGPLLLLYPTFLAAGADLAASFFSARFMVLVLMGVSVSVLSLLLEPKKKNVFPIAAGIIMVLWLITSPSKLPQWVMEWSVPAHSLRPIRAFLPYLNVVFAYLIIRYSNSSVRRYAALGALAGLDLLWSNDYGISSSLLLICFSLALLAKERQVTLSKIGALLAMTILVGAGSFTLATHGFAVPLLKYNFLDVAKDQWWYFAPWDEPSRIFGFRDLYKLWDRELGLGVAVLLGLSVVAYHRPSLKYGLLLYLGVALFAGGFVASAGGHIGGYFAAFGFWSKMTLILAVLRLPYIAVSARLRPRVDKVFGLVMCVLLLAASVIAANKHAGRYHRAGIVVASDQHRFYVPELGGYLPVEWQNYIDEARKNQGKKFVEEYWGLWSAMQRKPVNIPVDSVIHALGGTRDQVARFMEGRPDIVITTRRSYNVVWQTWSLNANWWFYKHLLAHYSPESLSPTTIVWRKKTKEETWDKIPCSVKLQTISLQPKGVGYYEVTVNYRLGDSGLRNLVSVRNNINYVAGSGGYLSLDPTATQAIFPAYLTDPEAEQLDFIVESGYRVRPKLEIENCSAQKLPLGFHDEVLETPNQLQ